MFRALLVTALAAVLASGVVSAQQTDQAADKPAASPAPVQPADQGADKPAPAQPADQGADKPAAVPAPAAAPQAEASGKPGIGGIKSAALVAFSVPRNVAEASAGALSGLSALNRLASGGMKGNGPEVARDAMAGFIEQMNQGRFELVSMDRVLGNEKFKALAAAHDQSKKGAGNTKSSFAGLPVIVLSKTMEQSAFAADAAKAIGVDGVVLVDVTTLNYVMWTGAMGSGTAKARGVSLFKLYDREGRAVWETTAAALTETTGAMVGGALNPSAAPLLHKDIGVTMAKDLQKNYPAGK